MANEGLRPYWFDSSIAEKRQRFRLRFYYPADIESITILDKTTGTASITAVKKEGEYLYTRKTFDGMALDGAYNNGNTVIYDQRQKTYLQQQN